MNIKVLMVSVVVFLFFAACGGTEESESASAAADASADVGTQKAALAELTQVVMGEPFRVDAAALPAALGAPWLEGNVVFKFESVSSGISIKDEVLPKVSSTTAGRTGDFYAAHGTYLAVTYTITAETKGLPGQVALRPSIHVDGAFQLADDQDNLYDVYNPKILKFGATASHRGFSFPVSAAIALQEGKDDPRKYVDSGQTITSVMAFDVPKDIGEVRLRSEFLGIELPLGTLASMLP